MKNKLDFNSKSVTFFYKNEKLYYNEKKQFKLSYSEVQIKRIISKLAFKIHKNLVSNLLQERSENLETQSFVFIVMLEGTFFFASDLIQYLGQLGVFGTLDFIQSSYEGRKSSKKIKSMLPLSNPKKVEGKTLILIEEMVDTDLTLKNIIKDLRKLKPLYIKTVALFFKSNIINKKL